MENDGAGAQLPISQQVVYDLSGAFCPAKGTLFLPLADGVLGGQRYRRLHQSIVTFAELPQAIHSHFAHWTFGHCQNLSFLL